MSRPMAKASSLLAGASFAFAGLATPLATAQTSDPASAEVLFRDGKRLLEQRDYPAACAKLAESYRDDPATGTLLALAMCHEGEGKTATAWGEYTDAATRAKNEGRADREQAARARVAAIEPTLSTLTITEADGASRIDGLVVKRDGSEVGAGVFGSSIPIDPGDHTIEASAPGRVPWRATLVIGTNPEKKQVVVPALDMQGTHSSLGTVQIAGIVVGAAGAVGVVLGTVFGLNAVSRNDASKSGCDGDVCYDPVAKQARLDARSDGNASTVSFIAGGALLAGGVTMILLGHPKEDHPEALRLVPAGSFDRVLLVLDGRF